MDDGVGLDFDHGLVVNELGDLNHRCRGADRLEVLAVHLGCFAPAGDVGHVDPGPDDVGGFAAQGLDRRDDDFQSARRV